MSKKKRKDARPRGERRSALRGAFTPPGGSQQAIFRQWRRLEEERKSGPGST